MRKIIILVIFAQIKVICLCCIIKLSNYDNMFRLLTTYTPNVDVLKACENAYILVEFIFRLVENSLRKRSQQTVVMPRKFKNYNFKVSPCCACKHTHLKLSKYIVKNIL